MKRIVALLMVVVMVLSLCTACKEKEKESEADRARRAADDLHAAYEQKRREYEDLSRAIDNYKKLSEALENAK